MKKTVLVVMALAILILPVSASARPHHGGDDHQHKYRSESGHHTNYNHRYHDDRQWRHSRHEADSRYDNPFDWHEHYQNIRSRHHLERLDNHEWHHRFPGTVAHRWHSDRGFWHRGNHVTDAVFFFSEDNRLVSIGYVANGVFIHFREDSNCYENSDSFLIAWMQH